MKYSVLSFKGIGEEGVDTNYNSILSVLLSGRLSVSPPTRLGPCVLCVGPDVLYRVNGRVSSRFVLKEVSNTEFSSYESREESDDQYNHRYNKSVHMRERRCVRVEKSETVVLFIKSSFGVVIVIPTFLVSIPRVCPQ